MLSTILIVVSLILIIGIVLCWVLFGLSTSSHDPREFYEPQSDARFELATPRSELVEIDTAGAALPPSEVMVYRYRWSGSLGRMAALPPIPLSRYCILQDDPEIECILGRQAPVTWDHSAIKLPSGPETTANGAPLDCALGASPLPAGLGKFEV